MSSDLHLCRLDRILLKSYNCQILVHAGETQRAGSLGSAISLVHP